MQEKVVSELPEKELSTTNVAESSRNKRKLIREDSWEYARVSARDNYARNRRRYIMNLRARSIEYRQQMDVVESSSASAKAKEAAQDRADALEAQWLQDYIDHAIETNMTEENMRDRAMQSVLAKEAQQAGNNAAWVSWD